MIDVYSIYGNNEGQYFNIYEKHGNGYCPSLDLEKNLYQIENYVYIDLLDMS